MRQSRLDFLAKSRRLYRLPTTFHSNNEDRPSLVVERDTGAGDVLIVGGCQLAQAAIARLAAVCDAMLLPGADRDAAFKTVEKTPGMAIPPPVWAPESISSHRIFNAGTDLDDPPTPATLPRSFPDAMLAVLPDAAHIATQTSPVDTNHPVWAATWTTRNGVWNVSLFGQPTSPEQRMVVQTRSGDLHFPSVGVDNAPRVIGVLRALGGLPEC